MNLNLKDVDKSVLMNLVEGFVGMEASVAFVDFIGRYERQVTLDDILINGRLDLLKEWGINDHSAFVEKISASKRLESPLNQVELKNIADYIRMMPSEIGVILFEHFSSVPMPSNFAPEVLVNTNLVRLFEYTYDDGYNFRQLLGEMMADKKETPEEGTPPVPEVKKKKKRGPNKKKNASV